MWSSLAHYPPTSAPVAKNQHAVLRDHRHAGEPWCLAHTAAGRRASPSLRSLSLLCRRIAPLRGLSLGGNLRLTGICWRTQVVAESTGGAETGDVERPRSKSEHATRTLHVTLHNAGKRAPWPAYRTTTTTAVATRALTTLLARLTQRDHVSHNTAERWSGTRQSLASPCGLRVTHISHLSDGRTLAAVRQRCES